MRSPVRVNMGCGATPTNGWINYDVGSLWTKNPGVRFLVKILRPHTVLSSGPSKDVRYADATKRIPLPDKSVDVVYSSHMVEHLDPKEAEFFLREARRVLVPSGILRLVLPDLQLYIDKYNADRDADAFLARLLFRYTRPRNLRELIKYHYIVGRCHYYMYNDLSIVKRLEGVGFKDVNILPLGCTNIPNPGDLDLFEQSTKDSLYVEAREP